MKPALAVVVLIATCPALATVAQLREPPEAPAIPPALQQLDPLDRSFAETFIATGLGDIEISRLAAKRADDEELRRLGTDIAAALETANRQLRDVLAPMQLAPLPDEPDADHKTVFDHLQHADNDEFARLYLATLQRDHDDLVHVLEMQRRSGTHAALREFAARWLPPLRAGLARIDALAVRMRPQ